MSTIKKPSFQVKPQKIEQGFEEFADDIKDIQTAKGSISMNKLSDKVDDSIGYSTLDTVRDEFSRDVHHRGDACSAAYTSYDEPPKRLSSKKVETVFTALLKAKSKVEDLDKNGDGVIGLDEAQSATSHRGLANKILTAAMEGEIDKYQSEMRSWIYDLNSVSMSLERRVEDENDIKSLTRFHAKSKDGAEALAWAFRDLKTSTGDGLRNLDIDGVLMIAESTPVSLKKLVYGDDSDTTGKGHLDDSEIMGMLETDDLKAYIETTKAKVEAQTGGYFSAYLKGADLDGVDQLNDPDYTAWVNDNSC